AEPDRRLPTALAPLLIRVHWCPFVVGLNSHQIPSDLDDRGFRPVRTQVFAPFFTPGKQVRLINPMKTKTQLLALLVVLTTAAIPAATLPPGFSESVVASGLS